MDNDNNAGEGKSLKRCNSWHWRDQFTLKPWCTPIYQSPINLTFYWWMISGKKVSFYFVKLYQGCRYCKKWENTHFSFDRARNWDDARVEQSPSPRGWRCSESQQTSRPTRQLCHGIAKHQPWGSVSLWRWKWKVKCSFMWNKAEKTNDLLLDVPFMKQTMNSIKPRWYDDNRQHESS